MQRLLLYIPVFIPLFMGMVYNVYSLSPQNKNDLFSLSGRESKTEHIDNLNTMSLNYRWINMDSAILMNTEAYSMARSIEYTKGWVDAIYNKSLIHRSMGEHVSALIQARRYLYISDSLKDSLHIARANNFMGKLKSESSYNKSAVDYYRTALNIYLKKHDTLRLIAVYNNLGNYYEDISSYDSAAIYFNEAYVYSVILNREAYQGIILNNLGKVNRLQGYHEDARKYLELSTEINRKYSAINLANAYSELGALAFGENNWDKAYENFKIADSIYRNINNQRGVSDCYINIAALYNENKDYDKALNNIQAALRYYREQDIAEGMIVAWQAMASVYYKNEDINTALMYNDSCLNLAILTNDLKRQKETLEEIYEIYFRQENFEEAIYTLLKIMEIDDHIYDLESAEIINELNIKFDRSQYLLRDLAHQNIILQTKKQRNVFLYTGISLIIIILSFLLFLRYRSRKNSIIAKQKIKQLEEEKKFLAARFLVEGQESERKRIATAIHDSLGVLLSTSKMHLTAIKARDPEDKALLDKATKFLDDANGEMRKISHNMMPGLLSKLGLCEALEDLFETLNDSSGMSANMEVEGPKNRLPENKEIMIYRVVQEMVNNTLKHANATQIDLNIVIQPDEINLTYSDDGQGFNLNEIINTKTIGIQNIRSRVKFLDGDINIHSSEGNGVFYRISIPMDSNINLSSV